MDNDKFVLNIIDFLTDKCIKAFKWLGKMSGGKNTKDSIYIFTKIIITLLLLALLEIPFGILNSLGEALIYLIGSTFRSFLAASLGFVLKLSYIILCLMILLKVFKSILSNKELNLYEQNRKKDTKVKNKIFLPIISFIKVCLHILLIPIVCIMGLLFVLIGMNIYLCINGYLLISPFFMYIGLLIVLYAVAKSINDVIEECDK